MSWRRCVRNRLSSGKWIPIRDLFDEVINDIPLHHAFRHADRLGKPDASLFEARFRLFINELSMLKLEKNVDGPYSYPNTKVRLYHHSSEDPEKQFLIKIITKWGSPLHQDHYQTNEPS